MTRVTLVADTEQELQESVDHYLKMYHPAGYGTEVVHQKRRPDGQWEAVITRETSCD